MRGLQNVRLGLRLALDETLRAAAVQLELNPDRTLPDGELIRDIARIGTALDAVEKEIARRSSEGHGARTPDEENTGG
ncbi:MAG: hypothetical protein WD470_00795 [Rhodospirillaceae bacterium]